MTIKPEDYNMKVLLGLPFAGRYVPPMWAVTLAALCWPMNIKHALYPVVGKPREQAREEIIEKAIELKSKYVGMLDDDVVPPADAPMLMVRELEMHEEFDIIAGIVTSKSPNGEPMIFKGSSGGSYWKWKVGEIFEVDEIATAFILIRTSLFETLPKPWFRDLNTLEEEKEAGVYREPRDASEILHKAEMTDDIYFCKKAKAAGHRILAHGGILCRHYDQSGNAFTLPEDSYPFWPPVPHIMDIRDAMKIDGWMSPLELAWLAQWAKVSSNIVEIGSFQGRSTKALVQNAKGTVTAVDTWGGDASTRAALEAAGNRILTVMPPEYLFEEFQRNMEGHSNLIIKRMKSLEAAASLNGDKFDLIFIDAGHDYVEVKADVEAWRPHLAPGGLLAGHDYDPIKWPQVVRAVDELLPERKIAVDSIWMWRENQ